eukprot:Awhi_evm4s13264
MHNGLLSEGLPTQKTETVLYPFAIDGDGLVTTVCHLHPKEESSRIKDDLRNILVNCFHLHHKEESSRIKDDLRNILVNCGHGEVEKKYPEKRLHDSFNQVTLGQPLQTL